MKSREVHSARGRLAAAADATVRAGWRQDMPQAELETLVRGATKAAREAAAVGLAEDDAREVCHGVNPQAS